ncbi:antibiotic biosynthesis monooxygenase family protein [Saccharopolyspora sp. 5N102]|uniref:antibiotic biosynthesis monooxygenase family protein n=1 Tax=Saccharopolyspora sp. 5N102 TaxID=3375155 RepID=UPI00378D0F08
MTTTTIDPNADVATLINVFTVVPERQRELVDLLVRATEEVMQHRPGFVAANIHTSLDGTRVTNYAQWESVQAFQEMLADPVCQEHMSAAREIADAEPFLYDVASVHHG